MGFQQRALAQILFRRRLSELCDGAFESFFHTLMELCHPGYVPVRTHGSLGDQGADGISLHDRTLFACYGPQTFDVNRVRAKFRSDLGKAIAKRAGDFDTFVFVHNDRRGLHPEVGRLLVSAAAEHEPLLFDQWGELRLWHKAMLLDPIGMEELLGCELPIGDVIYGIGAEDLAPLLEHLRATRTGADQLQRIPGAGIAKIEFNRLGEDDRRLLVTAMRDTYLVGEYYAGLRDPKLEDEVAAGFTAYYRQVRDQHGDDPEAIMWDLQSYVNGNRAQPSRSLMATWVVLAYFFERCHIFETPPPGWESSASETANA